MQKALYGCLTTFADVTDIVRNKKQELFNVDNTTFKLDPVPNKTKFLKIVYANGRENFFAENSKIRVDENESYSDFEAFKKMHDSQALVTFIIPTIGRSSLEQALKSLESMESKQWKAIVMFDGSISQQAKNTIIQTLHQQYLYRGNLISILDTGKKLGFANCAGSVRNIAMQKADTEWLAFLDDDDVVTQDYMCRLEMEIKTHPTADVIVFRMLSMNMVMPPGNFVSRHNVGISFAMKRHLFEKQGFQFQASQSEDIDLLTKLQSKGKHIVVSSHITYLVRPPSS